MRMYTQYGHALAAVVARGGGAALTRARVLARVRTHALMRTHTQYWHTLAAVVQRAVRAHRARAQVRQRPLQDAYK